MEKITNSEIEHLVTAFIMQCVNGDQVRDNEEFIMDTLYVAIDKIWEGKDENF
jgi:transposase